MVDAEGLPAWQAAAFLAQWKRKDSLRDVYMGHHHPDYLREAAEAIGKYPTRRVSADNWTMFSLCFRSI